MNENKNFNQQAHNWWIVNRRVIKAGIACGLVGVACGFIKGVIATNKLWMAHDTTHVNFNIIREKMPLNGTPFVRHF